MNSNTFLIIIKSITKSDNVLDKININQLKELVK